MRKRGHPYRKVNGHQPIKPELRKAILEYVQRVRRPVTTVEVAAVLHYSHGHMLHVMRGMALDGQLAYDGPRYRNQANLFVPAIPVSAEDEPKRDCTVCRQTKPLSAFHIGRADCKPCRSRKAGILPPYGLEDAAAAA